MKLLTKTTLFFLTIALFVLFVGGILFYFSFRYMVNREVRRELIIEMHQVIQRPPQNAFIGIDSVVFDLPVRYQIVPINEIKKAGFEFSDTLFFDNVMSIYQPFRIINYETAIYGKPVRISISKSLLISDELIEYVAFVTLFLSVVLLLCIIVFNNYFFSSIWGNFFKTIKVIKDYNISDTKEIVLPESEIKEFKLLNDGFEKMHQRIKQDYKNLKEFIENISHEIQTPLAIMKTKIDLLQQDESLNQFQIDLIQSVSGSASRLSTLNKSMILLSKIDNNQFSIKENVDIVEVVNFHLVNFEDIIQAKQISLNKVFTTSLVVLADSNLVSIMLLNLLKNSIYHNYQNGMVEVVVESNSLIIKNSGNKLDIKKEDIFKRFVKSSARPDSLGLGLAIVKKICDYYQFQVHYTYRDNIHMVTINFVN